MILTLQENVKQYVILKWFNVLKIVGRTLNVAVHALGTKLFVSTHAHVTPVKWLLTVTPFHGNDHGCPDSRSVIGTFVRLSGGP